MAILITYFLKKIIKRSKFIPNYHFAAASYGVQ